ncbi:MAG: tRNA (adenosine(37)-N6)-threonylcarbamoyltransferase complex ATPase subunit type 1 TsaE [Steroidobacteraceae bacterium]
MRTWLLRDAEATAALARAVVQAQPTAHAPRLIALHGELGAGKTSFVQAFLAACGVRAAVRSPTYTLVESYVGDAGQALVHADLYRLAAAQEFEELGLREEFRPGATWLVEWPERARDALPAADLELNLVILAQGRRAEVAAGTPAGAEWLQAVAADP